MLDQNAVWLATDASQKRSYLLPQMSNRHGIVSGATGTGKTTTLKVMIEGFSEAGIPTFVADVKGDLASLSLPGEHNENMQSRFERFGITEWEYRDFPVQLWDIYEEYGMPVRATVSSMGPVMLSRLLGLSDAQEGVLNVVFHIADDRGLKLIDLKDLTSTLQYVYDHRDEYRAEYGNVASVSVSTIQRILLQLRDQGGDAFFGEPELDIFDWIRTDENGRGIVNLLHSASLIQKPRLYSMFLLWMLGELFNRLPEVGDTEKPKIVFFFDEAHLLFKNAPAALVDKIEQVVKLIRSKGVGVFFCTQSPSDIPDSVLAQLSNRVQHALRAYTPNDRKTVKAAADGFRQNPNLNLVEAITELKTGEAIVTFLQEDGSPTMAERVFIMPPQSRFGTVTDEKRNELIAQSDLRAKYAEAYDPISAYEILTGQATAEDAAKEEEIHAEETSAYEPGSMEYEMEQIKKRKAEMALEKERLKLEQERTKLEQEKAKLAEQKKKSKKKKTSSTAKKVWNTALNTTTRNITNRLIRGILGNLFK
ncbi:MAG: DUF853 family protein [Erysipelotrichales bacterium]|nr:DUF853 family protein [Erysipelotrichales bacterium]